ncbi:hypothetical protein [Pseudomonas moraviensis]|uniref:Uncharacterized protein n=1 Tax=Pseudomonas moraviensis TaxID=321662 RepID=A0A7Y9VV30_9PSED|nr:hypothetical protein [Pseudomonas moraviensis]NYH09116.1 hypothetical protein [Pseudomonas moraviensis]
MAKQNTALLNKTFASDEKGGIMFNFYTADYDSGAVTGSMHWAGQKNNMYPLTSAWFRWEDNPPNSASLTFSCEGDVYNLRSDDRTFNILYGTVNGGAVTLRKLHP